MFREFRRERLAKTGQNFKGQNWKSGVVNLGEAFIVRRLRVHADPALDAGAAAAGDSSEGGGGGRARVQVSASAPPPRADFLCCSGRAERDNESISQVRYRIPHTQIRANAD